MQRLQPGEWVSQSLGGRGTGTLEARRLQTGAVVYYLRIVTGYRRQQRIRLGTLRYRDALQHATELSVRYQSGDHQLPVTLKAEQAAAEQRNRQAKADDQRTLGTLLTAYVDQLQRGGKTCAATLQRELRYHVQAPWPKLWVMPLSRVTTDDLLGIVAKPVEAGHLRQAEKVRAYLRAAYSAAIRARRDAKALPQLRALRVTDNPARDLVPVAGANRARDRALSLAELRAYWRRIQGDDAAVLRFHLVTGCQRIQQLARVTIRDVDHDTETMRLLDPKGRRTEPRQHHVPLLPEALAAMLAMHSGGSGPYVFTVTTGESGADYSSICHRLRAVVAVMTEGSELPGGQFTLGDLRRTVETRLADAGISSDVLARLQSHGLGGVQARHYNRATYLPQTRAALETLLRLVTGVSADVVPLSRGRVAGATA